MLRLALTTKNTRTITTAVRRIDGKLLFNVRMKLLCNIFLLLESMCQNQMNILLSHTTFRNHVFIPRAMFVVSEDLSSLLFLSFTFSALQSESPCSFHMVISIFNHIDVMTFYSHLELSSPLAAWYDIIIQLKEQVGRYPLVLSRYPKV